MSEKSTLRGRRHRDRVDARRGRPRGGQDRHRLAARHFAVPAGTARPRTRRRHDRPDHRAARRAVRPAWSPAAGGSATGPAATPAGPAPGCGEDLDALEEFTQGYEGPLKVQAVGPWTLAAALELRGGEAVLGDPGACRDLAGSLAEGLRAHLADVRRRVPGAEVVLQLDEPSLTAVLRGRVRTASGYRTYRAVDRAGGRGRAAGADRASTRRARRRALLRARTCRSRCCAGPGSRASPSTSRCSPSVTRRRSGRRSRAAPRCFAGVVPGRTPTRPHCQTRPVASWVSGRCGAGWG